LNTIQIFPGGSPDAVTADYKAWLVDNPGVTIIGTPRIEQAGTGWILTVMYQPPSN